MEAADNFIHLGILDALNVYFEKIIMDSPYSEVDLNFLDIYDDLLNDLLTVCPTTKKQTNNPAIKGAIMKKTWAGRPGNNNQNDFDNYKKTKALSGQKSMQSNEERDREIN